MSRVFRIRVLATAVLVLCSIAGVGAGGAAAATVTRPPVYKPVTPKAWTYSPSFNKAKFDPSIIRLSSPSRWRVTPKVPNLVTAIPVGIQPDLREWAEPVGNQGGVGSCTAWAIGYGMLGWWENKVGKITSREWFNPMSLYSVTRIPTDNGAWPVNVFPRVKDVGLTKAADYSVDAYNYTHSPTPAEILAANPYRFSSWRNLFANPDPFNGGGAAGASMIKKEIWAGRPVAVSARVYSDFTGLGATSSSFVYSKSASASYRGLHEMLAVGFNSSGLLLQNSWGTGFADKGFVRVSWSYVNSDIFEADLADGVI